MKKALCIIALLFTLSFISADDITIVLQNGSLGYTGCSDSYIHKQIDTNTYENTNYGNKNNLDIYACPT